MRKLLIFLIVSLVLVAVTDRVAHAGAESVIATQVSKQYPMTNEPDVTIEGFPFLNQAVSGNYEEIHIVTGAFSMDGVQLKRVDLTAYNVRMPIADLLSTPTAVADRVDGKVLIPYSEMQKRVPEGLTVENDSGDLLISGDLAVGGFSVPVDASLELSIQEDTISAKASNVEVGKIPVPVGRVEERLSFAFPLGELPLNLSVTDIAALPTGLEVSAQGTDIPLAGGGPQ